MKHLFTPFLIVVVIILFVMVVAKPKLPTNTPSVNTPPIVQPSEQDKKNKEQAQNIVRRVQSLMDIDTTIEPTVATIVDVEKLRKQNAFYNKAKNGDFLVVTPTRAILYDLVRHRIIDVVPVQIDPPSSLAPRRSAKSGSGL